MQAYPTPQGGASLVLAFRLHAQTILILGSGPLAASRAFAALEADSEVVVLAKGCLATACDEIQWRVTQKQLSYIDWNTLPAGSSATEEERDLDALEFYFKSSTRPVRLVCMTDTLSTAKRHRRSFARKVFLMCKARNIPVNTTDMPDLCDFTFMSTHRFEDLDTGKRTPLQVGVTTNGHGCRLASRIRRDIVARLSANVGGAVQSVGRMRSMVVSRTGGNLDTDDDELEANELNEDGGVTTPNRPVPSRNSSHDSASPYSYAESETEGKIRKIQWVAQVSEYWPISRLAQMTESEMVQVLSGDLAFDSGPASHAQRLSSPHALSLINSASLRPTKPGRLILVGSGPGHPSLLTLAAHTVLTQFADLVLSDKLVPEAVLALIPARVPVKIARKFPGNADGAQEEMMREAVDAVGRGLCVVRLKQGDTQIYARAAEEILVFRQRLPNAPVMIIPGISSALAGPTCASISVTQRGVAESFVVCTGVGRSGKNVSLPGYERARTTVMLMGVARLGAVVAALTETTDEAKARRGFGSPYPLHLPIAIIERASMPDQRVVTSTLQDIVAAMESVGEQRPPGMIVVGWAVLGLWEDGEVGSRVLDDAEQSGDGDGEMRLEEVDKQRVEKWLGGARWRVEEGLGNSWRELEGVLQS